MSQTNHLSWRHLENIWKMYSPAQEAGFVISAHSCLLFFFTLAKVYVSVCACEREKESARLAFVIFFVCMRVLVCAWMSSSLRSAFDFGLGCWLPGFTKCKMGQTLSFFLFFPPLFDFYHWKLVYFESHVVSRLACKFKRKHDFCVIASKTILLFFFSMKNVSNGKSVACRPLVAIQGKTVYSPYCAPPSNDNNRSRVLQNMFSSFWICKSTYVFYSWIRCIYRQNGR